MRRAKTKHEKREPLVPDLLHRTPSLRFVAEDLDEGLSFAFVSGDSNGVIERAFTEMKVGPSSWSPEAYEEDLFLGDLIERCMRAGFEGFRAPLNLRHLERLLSSPPRERADVELRREVLTELWENEAARAHVQTVYRTICQIIGLFDTHGYQSRYDDLERRLEIVTLIRDLVLHLGAPPPTHSEGLARMRRFGEWIAEGEPFRRLAEFVAYEQQLSSVDLSLQIGVDGKIRRFSVLKVEESSKNRFYQSPVWRLWHKLWLFLRGYRFTETQIVERWIDDVFTGALEFVPLIFQLKADLELYLAAIAFREACEARGLSVCLPELLDEEPASDPVRIVQMFNPLLFAQEIIPTCCDLETARGDAILVITGPNSGGKTRLLQAMAIIQLFAQVGIWVPAEAARLRWVSGMFVSLVEGVKVSQEEGRLGGEMLRIRRLFEQSGDVSLVIIDELCSGTNPSEGEEIFQLVLSLLRELRPLVLITTHFLEFAKRLHASSAGLEFLQVELDAESQPTFGFVPGVAQTSLARQTAARLGVTREDLMALIEKKRGG